MDIIELYKKLNHTKNWLTPKKLKEIRKGIYGMTQTQFAELLGISYNTYISWECGRYNPSTPAQALLHVAAHHKDIFLKQRSLLFEKIKEFT